MMAALKTLLAVLLLGVAWPAGAQADRSQALAGLGAPDYATRQAMTWQMLRDDTLTLVELAHLYQDASTLEQRQRLRTIFHHHAIRQMHQTRWADQRGTQGSIGLAHRVMPANTLDPQPHPAVHVNQTLPGFPGYAYLQPGDLILTINRQPMPKKLTAEAFMHMIQNKPPGQRINLELVRAGQRVHVAFPLASAMSLGRMYRSANQLADPFAQTWRTQQQALLTGDFETLQSLTAPVPQADSSQRPGP